MRYPILFLFIGLTTTAFAQLKYPETKEVDQVDEYFGQKIPDPYRWLEDDHSAETMDWVKRENSLTQSYLSRLPNTTTIKNRIKELYNFPRVSPPYRAGKHYFYTRNNGLQNQSVYYYTTDIHAEGQVFLDPNTLSKDGTSYASLAGFNKDRTKVAITVSKSGSDWQTIYVMDVATKKFLPDSIQWVKFSGAAWFKDGFFYSRYDEPTKGNELSAENKGQKVYYHKLGTPQAKDKLIYQDPAHPKRFFSAQVTDDETFLIVNASEGTSGSEILAKYLVEPQDKTPGHGRELQVICKGFEFEFNVIDNVGTDLYVHTNFNAPNFKLIKFDFNHPDEPEWKVVIPETENLLQQVSSCGDRFFCTYLKDATSKVVVWDKKAEHSTDLELPEIGTVSAFTGEQDDNDVYFSISNFTSPATIYKYEISANKVSLFERPKLSFNPEDFETKQVFYSSKDGTKVPMFLVYKKGIKLDGNNPTLLYGYGGFNIPLTPTFNPSRIVLLENGGIFAMANLRGGSEYGEKWHEAGMLQNKQNVFDDFISAAEYLISNQYTSSEKLGIIGRSNGGLLVGACMTQKPDLFKVCFPSVGVLDMLRYHKFTIGWGWAVEYGSSENLDQYKTLIAYSPLHNIRKTAYPATLIVTADHDDRVVPAHSFKFAATLQKNQTGNAPVLIRIDSNAGHGAGRSLVKTIDEDADIYSFFFNEVGVKSILGNPVQNKEEELKKALDNLR